MKSIDFHVHAFPDALAQRAIPHLEREADVTACLDGKLSSVLRSMDRSGIEHAVVSSIATRPSQFESILSWSRGIASRRIIPFASFHPDDPAAIEQIGRIHEAGLKGVKLHPYYQDFVLDEARMMPLYDAMCRRGLICLVHTGFDIAFARKRIADPQRICRVVEAFPDFKFVATHFGAWEDWDEVARLMLGKPIYMDVSYSVGFMGERRAGEMLASHPAEYVLFGSDSPWGDQEQTLAFVRNAGLGVPSQEAILGKNAARLLGLNGG